MEIGKSILQEVLKYTGKSKNSLAKAIGLPRSQNLYDIESEKVKRISSELSEKISLTYPEINRNWLLTGEGSMLLNSTVKNSLSTNPGVSFAPKGRFRKRSKIDLVKFYDSDFAAGDIEFYDDRSAIKPAYEMDIPEFSGCTAFRTYGDSMEPMIKSGSILFGTRVEDWQSHLEYGQIFGIVCIDNRKYLKYIRKDKSKHETHYLLRSENKEYDDFELPKEKIKHIWLIHGWINKRN